MLPAKDQLDGTFIEKHCTPFKSVTDTKLKFTIKDKIVAIATFNRVSQQKYTLHNRRIFG